MTVFHTFVLLLICATHMRSEEETVFRLRVDYDKDCLTHVFKTPEEADKQIKGFIRQASDIMSKGLGIGIEEVGKPMMYTVDTKGASGFLTYYSELTKQISGPHDYFHIVLDGREPFVDSPSHTHVAGSGRVCENERFVSIVRLQENSVPRSMVQVMLASMGIENNAACSCESIHPQTDCILTDELMKQERGSKDIFPACVAHLMKEKKSDMVCVFSHKREKRKTAGSKSLGPWLWVSVGLVVSAFTAVAILAFVAHQKKAKKTKTTGSDNVVVPVPVLVAGAEAEANTTAGKEEDWVAGGPPLRSDIRVSST